MKLNFWQIVGLALILVGIIGILWARRGGNGSESKPAAPTQSAPATQQTPAP